jgi:hypothetical protein
VLIRGLNNGAGRAVEVLSENHRSISPNCEENPQQPSTVSLLFFHMTRLGRLVISDLKAHVSSCRVMVRSSTANWNRASAWEKVGAAVISSKARRHKARDLFDTPIFDIGLSLKFLYAILTFHNLEDHGIVYVIEDVRFYVLAF